MGASLPVSTGPWPATPSSMHPRIVWTLATVVLIHAALVAALVLNSGEPPPRPVALQTITAQLLSPEPATAPMAVESAASPRRVPPALAPPKPQRSPAKAIPSRPLAPIKPPGAATAPPNPAPPAEPAQHTPATTQAPSAIDTAQTTPPAASARGQETLAASAPKSIEHVECGIVKPDYPAISRRRAETGTVSVRFVIGVTGAIERVELAKSSGYERLDDAALAAMRASSCHPYVENGTPVRVVSTQPFAFALDDD